MIIIYTGFPKNKFQLLTAWWSRTSVLLIIFFRSLDRENGNLNFIYTFGDMTKTHFPKWYKNTLKKRLSNIL